MINNGELHLLDWYTGRAGGFIDSLFEAICRADKSNLLNLATGFPEEVEAFRKFRHQPGYLEELEKRYAEPIEASTETIVADNS